MKRQQIEKQVEEIFMREFGFDEFIKPMFKKLNFRFDYRYDFDFNLKKIKQNFKLSDDICTGYKEKYSEYYKLKRLEHHNYSKKMVSDYYSRVFSKKDALFFIDSVRFIIKTIENLESNYNNPKNMAKEIEYDRFSIIGHRLIINMLLGLSFEYVCKGFLLSKGYRINVYKENKIPIKDPCIEVTFDKTRTINIEIIWGFICKNHLLKFKKKELMTGNYLTRLRNNHSHVPFLFSESGDFRGLCLNLIDKINNTGHALYYLEK